MICVMKHETHSHLVSSGRQAGMSVRRAQAPNTLTKYMRQPDKEPVIMPIRSLLSSSRAFIERFQGGTGWIAAYPTFTLYCLSWTFSGIQISKIPSLGRLCLPSVRLPPNVETWPVCDRFKYVLQRPRLLLAMLMMVPGLGYVGGRLSP